MSGAEQRCDEYLLTHMQCSFMQSVQEGELLIQQGPDQYIAAAAAFFKGLKVYPKPLELLMIYQKAVPEPALNYIYEMVGRDVSSVGNVSCG